MGYGTTTDTDIKDDYTQGQTTNEGLPEDNAPPTYTPPAYTPAYTSVVDSDITQGTQQTQQQGQNQGGLQGTGNTVVEVNLNATLSDGWYFASPQMEYLLPELNNPYAGPYHLMEDGTYMAGEGVLNASHEINPNEIIIQDYSAASTYGLPEGEVDLDLQLDSIEGELTGIPFETIQDVREAVSDTFYKLFFENNNITLSDEDIKKSQTTIRDGKQKTGRTEEDKLVFYKKDRNTLENRKDLQGDHFKSICQYLYDNYPELTYNELINNYGDYFELIIEEEPLIPDLEIEEEPLIEDFGGE